MHARLVDGPGKGDYEIDDPPPPPPQRGFFLRRGQRFGGEAHRYRLRQVENDAQGKAVTAIYEYVDRVSDD